MKKIISCLAFIAVFFLICNQLTDILTPKAENRYYMLEKYLEENPDDTTHDVQVFGSCHSYTSFNPVYMEEVTGISGFVYGNAGEIIPTTYVRMREQFKKHIPKVALVEIWGINPYETYDTSERIFGAYFAKNLERTKFSLSKLEVISDFSHMKYEDINLVAMNIPFITYRDRLFDFSLTSLDFNYSFEELKPFNSNYTHNEMTSRLKNNGYKVNPPVAIEDYPQKQNYIGEDEFLEIEPDIVKYLQKIIELCKKNNVELIFYRSPYIVNENELKKLHHLEQICNENNVLFIDLEEEITFDYTLDFLDYQHLSEFGANKATEYLLPYIMEAMEVEDWKHQKLLRTNLLFNSDFTNPKNQSGKVLFENMGETIDGWYLSGNDIALTEHGIEGTINSDNEGWYLYQSIEITEELIGTSITAYFNINNCDGKTFRPIISLRNADNQEISYDWIKIEKGEHTITVFVPPDTKMIRVGIWAENEVVSGDSFSVRMIELYQGAFTVEQIHEMK